MMYLEPKHMICLDAEELKKLYGDETRNEIVVAIGKSGYTTYELNGDVDKMQEIVDAIKEKTLGDNTATEIFAALYLFLGFYEKESKLCFVLKKDFNPTKTPIKSFTDLKEAIRQDQEIDFGSLSGKDLRQFQLKRYRGNANTEEIFAFLKEKLGHYGNNLGDTNLLVVLQSPSQNLDQVDFDKLSRELKALNLTYTGEILIAFNAENKFNIIQRIYPERGTAKIPFILPSQQ